MANLPTHPTNPNDRTYSDTNLGTWNSVSSVNTFFSKFNHDNNYSDGTTELSVANYVTIQDGTYNAVWMIAGFDMEHNQTAADGTVYDNGYGICMIPKTQVTTSTWNKSRGKYGYMNSDANTSLLPNIVTKLKNVLGTHIINRNVLLSSNMPNGYPTQYTWTTAYATLMSVGQMTGTFAANHSKYDDGEANYKLPLFDSISYSTGSSFWTRGLAGQNSEMAFLAYGIYGLNVSKYQTNLSKIGIRPLIYLR